MKFIKPSISVLLIVVGVACGDALLEVITYSMESAKQVNKGAINFARELDLKKSRRPGF